MSVNAWLAYAVQHLNARFIAKLDDDAYLHAPAVEAILRQAMEVAPHPSHMYFGPMSWFHWYPAIFERSGFGWSYTMAWQLGQHCRNVTTAEQRCMHKGCGECVGPFPFASGFLAVLSTPLAADVLRENAVKDDDLRRLQAASRLPTRTGGEQIKVMEDIWLGSLLYRRRARAPMTYVALSERDEKQLVSDGWGLRVARSALVVHLKNHQTGKQLERFLLVDKFLRDGGSCSEELKVSCGTGCHAFLNPSELLNAQRVQRFNTTWVPRVEAADFCNGPQRGAGYCRVVPQVPRKCERKPVDLLSGHKALWASVRPHVQELVAATKQMNGEAERDLAGRQHAAAADRSKCMQNSGSGRGGC